MGARKRRDADGPRERPGGAPLTFAEMEAIAREEARRSPGLAPNGGRRWTLDDIAFADSEIFEEMRARGFRKAWDAGMTRAQAHHYLLKALHNRLLDHVRVVGRNEMLDGLAHDFLPASENGRTKLAFEDRAIFVGRVLANLSEAGCCIAADYLRVIGEAAAGQDGDRRPPMAAVRTRERHRARFREAVRSVARKAELTREELVDLLAALTAKLTGGEGG